MSPVAAMAHAPPTNTKVHQYHRPIVLLPGLLVLQRSRLHQFAGFFYITQRTVKEMLKQKAGCVVTITAALADRPIAGANGSVSMITKGGLNSATQNLAIEYAKEGIRFNAVAPGIVNTPMHPDDPNEPTSQPKIKKATVQDIVDAVLYLVKAGHVSGEILHVDGAAPARRW